MQTPKHIVATGVFVTNANNEVLLVKTELRGWELPGGQVNEGEDIFEALKREVLEESGINIRDIKLSTIYSNTTEPTKIIFDFTAVYESGELRTQPGETVDVKWVPIKSILTLKSTDSTSHRLDNFLQKRSGLFYESFRKDPFRIIRQQEL